jgi:hypothetical protein
MGEIAQITKMEEISESGEIAETRKQYFCHFSSLACVFDPEKC